MALIDKLKRGLVLLVPSAALISATGCSREQELKIRLWNNYVLRAYANLDFLASELLSLNVKMFGLGTRRLEVLPGDATYTCILEDMAYDYLMLSKTFGFVEIIQPLNYETKHQIFLDLNRIVGLEGWFVFASLYAHTIDKVSIKYELGC